jgi:hypothetical protein
VWGRSGSSPLSVPASQTGKYIVHVEGESSKEKGRGKLRGEEMRRWTSKGRDCCVEDSVKNQYWNVKIGEGGRENCMYVCIRTGRMYGDWENLFPPRGRLKILREINLSVP